MAKRKGSSRKTRPEGIATYLTNLRVDKGLTQQQIADKIGRSRSCICRIETGSRQKKSLHGNILFEIAIAYEVSIEDIQRKAYWPQSILPLDITDEEKQELMQHLERMRRQQPRPPEQDSA